MQTKINDRLDDLEFGFLVTRVELDDLRASLDQQRVLVNRLEHSTRLISSMIANMG